MLLLPRPRRRAWLGFSVMLTATSVWRISALAFNLGWLLQQGRNDGLIPEQQEPVGWVADGCEFGARNHNAGPKSPPIASSAIVSSLVIIPQYHVPPIYSANVMETPLSCENKGNLLGNNSLFFQSNLPL